MNTKLLKQKILDLAIRGKLTQQLKSDGTAADLLRQVSEQKRESSSTLSSPRRRGSPSAQSEKTIIPLDKSEAPFEIPVNWEWVRLGDVCDKLVDGDHNPPKGIATQTNYLMLSSRNINNDRIVELNNVRYLTKETFIEEDKRTNLSEGDILFTSVGSLGRSCVFDGKGNFCFQRSVTIVHTLIFNKYLKYFFDSGYYQKVVVDNATGTAQLGFYLEQMSKSIIALPPLAEQQRIVEKIQEAFAEIDSIENNKELLKTHIKQARQKILDLAIHGRLVPQNKNDEPASVLLERITRDNPHYEKIEDEPFEIPENWAWCKLGTLSESIQYGYNAPAKDFGRIKMVRISDIHENEVEWDSVPYCDIDEKEIQTYLLKKNDILFARTGGTVGKSFIVGNLLEDAVYAGYLIRTRYGKNANAQYMKHFMESNLYWEQLRDGCIATAQPNCNGKTLGKMKIPLPPLNEQSRIVAKIEELFTELDSILQNI